MLKFFKTICKVILLLALVAVILAGLALGSIFWYVSSYDNEQFTLSKFERGKWLADDGISNCVRGAMYRDLEKNYLKKGMSKAEVLELIGKADYGRIYHRFYGDKKCYEYPLGKCKWTPVRSTLMICYNNKNILKEFFLSDESDSGETINSNKMNW
jgi:hypothetical protein